MQRIPWCSRLNTSGTVLCSKLIDSLLLLPSRESLSLQIEERRAQSVVADTGRGRNGETVTPIRAAGTEVLEGVRGTGTIAITSHRVEDQGLDHDQSLPRIVIAETAITAADGPAACKSHASLIMPIHATHTYSGCTWWSSVPVDA